MTNEALLEHLRSGDESALVILCENNRRLISSRARIIARTYNCDGDEGCPRQLLSDLESEGMLAFIECVRSDRYDSSAGLLTTYVVPFIDGAMRRFLEVCMGTLSLSRDSMTLVRRAQELWNTTQMNVTDIASELGISVHEAARHLRYPTHFLSVYDLADSDDGNDVFDYFAADELTAPPETIVFRRLCIECLRELFMKLPVKDRDILGSCYGVFGYEKKTSSEIAMRQMIKEPAVEKARAMAVAKLRKLYPGSRLQLWKGVRHILDSAASESAGIPQTVWYLEEWALAIRFAKEVLALFVVGEILHSALGEED